jgi:hypothetical protein
MDEGIEYEWQDTLSNFNEIVELKRQNPDKVVLLLGNHDMHYRNSQFCKYAKSTRYDGIHSHKLNELFNGDNYKLFQLCYCVENNGRRIIFTHAGITKFWAEMCGVTYDDNIQDAINNLEESAEGIGKLAVIGRERTWLGEKTGSPIWCDLREFVSDETIDANAFQIFGHSRLKTGVCASTKEFACIDSRTAFILSDKNKLKKVKDEKVKANKEHGAVQNTEDDKP